MVLLWLIVWLDYGTPPLHNSGWLLTLILLFALDTALVAAKS